MIREKMFRLHRHKSSTKSGERIDFNFSNIQALQVPKGWDKLYFCLLSTETGKTINKSGKAAVQNGTCRWTETFSQSVWISHDRDSKELEQYLFKLVVTLGSARSSILGEATINLAGYMGSRASIPLSLPLKKCNHGTLLQIEIQCLTPRTKHRDEKWKDTNSNFENEKTDFEDVDNKSEVSDCTFSRSFGSSSSNQLDCTSHPRDLGSRETSFSASGSQHSFDSMEGSLGRESFSPQSNTSGAVKLVIGRQDSTGSQFSAPYGSYPVCDSPGSNISSIHSVISGSGRHLHNQREDSHAIVTSVRHTGSSSRNFMGIEESTIEELRAEARKWERNARKLMIDQELLSKEFAEQSKQLSNLDVVLSATRTECDGLRQEVQHLKFLLDKSMDKQYATENLKFQSSAMDNIQELLEDELKFQKETNDNLALQLKKTQDSNLELVSILQEMEETMEEQKLEIENLTKLNSKVGDTGEGYSFGHEDNEELHPSKEVTAETRKVSSDSDLQGSTMEHPITDLHAEINQEIRQLQESQTKLESTILYLEKTLEDKSHEIVIERDLRTRTLLECEEEWKHKLTAKEEEVVNLEAKLSKALRDTNSKLEESENGGVSNLLKEIETAREKVQEPQSDCNELTDENSELLSVLKEAGKNLPTIASFGSSFKECPANNFPVASDSEVSKHKIPLWQHDQEIKNDNIIFEGVASNLVQIRRVGLKNKCAKMELQLQAFKDKDSYLNIELQHCHSEAKEREIKMVALQRQLGSCQGDKIHNKDHIADNFTECESSESPKAQDKFKLLPALLEQLQLLFVNVQKQQYTLYSPIDTEYTHAVNTLLSLKCTELATQKELEEAALENLTQLNQLFRAKTTLCKDDLPCRNIASISTNTDGVRNAPEGDNLMKNTLCACCEQCEGINELNKEQESRVADLCKDIVSKASQIGEVSADRLLREEEIEALQHCQTDFKTQISDPQKIKEQLEENKETMQRDSSVCVTSKCSDNLKNDLTVLNGRMESRISEKKALDRISLELESAKCELELHLSEREKENVHLSGQISGLEAQLRYLTDATEASRLELQHSESHVMNLKDEVRRLENEMEVQKVTMKQKIEDMHKRWLEVQEECEYLKKANPKLQATAESLIDECSSLQKSNREPRQQKVDLHEYSTILGMELKESQDRFSNYSKKIEAVEAKCSTFLEGVSSKQKTMDSELDALHRQNSEHTEKLILEESLFNQMYLEKAANIEDDELKVADLTSHIPATRDERKGTAPDAVKTPSLNTEEDRSDSAFQEAPGKFKFSQKKLELFQMDYETKILCLMTELAASKENYETLVANHEKLLGLLEDLRSNEEKLKGTINVLESTLKSSEKEMLRLAEETSCLKVQLQKIPPLQDEVLALKGLPFGTQFENERLQILQNLLSGDHEELKTERLSLIQEISSMQIAMSELENCRCSKAALEGKILRLEGDLTASEALGTQDAELKNELGRIRRVNSQFQWKIKRLEEEKEDWLQRAQALELELKQKKEEKQEQVQSSSNRFLADPPLCATITTINQELKLSEIGEEVNNIQLNRDQLDPYMETDQLEQLSENGRMVQRQRQGSNRQHENAASSPKMENDRESRIQFLENELAEALEANKMYKEQLNSLLPEVQIGHSQKSEENKQKADLQEAELRELREIRERYFHMSLKYAEVEAQREQLVMKLKAVNSGKRWLS